MNEKTNVSIKRSETVSAGKYFTTVNLTAIAMLSAVATVLMLFEIPLWFAPGFYKLDLSEVPVLVGAFALGPLAGIIIELIKVLVNLFIDGSMTMGVGELANFIIGCSFVVPAAFIYQRNKSIKSALLGMIIGSIVMTTLGSFLNAVVLLPAFSFFTKTPIQSFIKMGSSVNSAITNMTTFILYAVAPFNLVKGVVSSAISMLLYKRISGLIKSFTK